MRGGGWIIPVIASLVFAASVSASVYINEFSSSSDPEWIELYNDSDSVVDITGWALKDKANPAKEIAGSIPAKSYFIFEHSGGWLNNDGDTITLLDNSTPSAQIVNHVVYGNEPEALVDDPDGDKSSGRTPDGSSLWLRNLAWTKSAANPGAPSATPQPTNTPSPVPTTTPAPSSTPKPTSTPKPSSTPKPVVYKSPTPLPDVNYAVGEVLSGQTETGAFELTSPTPVVIADVPLYSEAPVGVGESQSKTNSLIGWIMLGSGIVVLVVAGLLLVFRPATSPG